MVILGDSFLKTKSAEYLFHALKNFLINNEKLHKNWKPLNVLSQNASTVGNLDLDIINQSKDLIKGLKSNEFDVVFMLGQDNLIFDKKKEFIIYLGSHGDKSAEMADIILPGAAYTEQNGYFTNLEGKIQKAFKASYPPGDAKEDWNIINELAEIMNNRKLFNDKDELESAMFNYLKLKNEKDNISFKEIRKDQNTFFDENIRIEIQNYFFSNVIARASKTMLDCHNAQMDFRKTGTEG